MEETKNLSVPISKQLYVEARTVAGSLDISLAELVRRALADYLAAVRGGQGESETITLTYQGVYKSD